MSVDIRRAIWETSKENPGSCGESYKAFVTLNPKPSEVPVKGKSD